GPASRAGTRPSTDDEPDPGSRPRVAASSRARACRPVRSRATGRVTAVRAERHTVGVDQGPEPAGELRTESRTGPASRDELRCSACAHEATRRTLAIEVGGAHVRTFRNPAGWS